MHTAFSKHKVADYANTAELLLVSLQITQLLYSSTISLIFASGFKCLKWLNNK